MKKRKIISCILLCALVLLACSSKKEGVQEDSEKDEIRVYYGAADTYVGLATGKLSELIDMCINEK